MKRATVWAPLAAVAFGVLFFAGNMMPRSDRGKMHLSKLAQMPVIEGGRVKPLDTYARVQLMLMNRRQTYYDKDEKRQPAVRWLIDVLADGYGPFQASLPIRISDSEVREWFGLQDRPVGLYLISEVLAGAEKKDRELAQLRKQRFEALSPLEQNVVAVDAIANQRRELAVQVRDARKKAGLADDAPVFRIDNDQVLAMLNLAPREGLRYSFNEILGFGKDEAYREKMDSSNRRKYFEQLFARATQARERPAKERDLQDVKTLELFGYLETDRRLHRLGLREPDQPDHDRMRLVPDTTNDLEKWQTLGDAIRAGEASDNPAAASVEKIIQAYALNDSRTFNKEVDSYLATMKERMPVEMRRVSVETWFNNFEPFYQCLIMYVLVMLLAIASWVVWHEPLRRAAFWLAVVVVVVHTSALVLRMYLTGRPPVTNLYSSAVFIGWGCVLLCLVVERIYQNSIPLVVASVLGFATMIVAHHLGGSGDTMEVMQAVLDTNFWLATHVTTVTMGYTATFVAGFFAMVFIFRMLASAVRKSFVDREAPRGGEAVLFVVAVLGWLAVPTALIGAIFCGLWVAMSGGEGLDLGVVVALSLPLLLAAGFYAGLVIVRRFSKTVAPVPVGEIPPLVGVLDRLALTQSSSKGLAGMIYGTVCFATLLSFVGTVLGGIWADQSWGRFWGWDPKENGALLIVVMNALILHARWGGLIRERGLAVLAIVGNMVTAWSWFGTNQLGVGLHAYGFNTTLAQGCTYFWGSQMVLMLLGGLMPLRFWRAYAEKPAVTGAPLPTLPAGPRLQGGRGSTGIQPA